jgi:hypothetical protein
MHLPIIDNPELERAVYHHVGIALHLLEVAAQ